MFRAVGHPSAFLTYVLWLICTLHELSKAIFVRIDLAQMLTIRTPTSPVFQIENTSIRIFGKLVL